MKCNTHSSRIVYTFEVLCAAQVKCEVLTQCYCDDEQSAADRGNKKLKYRNCCLREKRVKVVR